MNARYFIERSALLTKCIPPLLGEGTSFAPKNVFFFDFHISAQAYFVSTNTFSDIRSIHRLLQLAINKLCIFMLLAIFFIEGGTYSLREQS